MPGKQIANDTGAWTVGATWTTAPLANTMSQFVANFFNASGQTLFTGDVVILGSGTTIPDPAGVDITVATTASSPYTVGVVGGETNMPGAGGPIPNELQPVRYVSATYATNSATITAADSKATDVGAGISGPGIPLGAYIRSVVVGTSFTISVNTTAASTTGIPVVVGPRTSSVGPGWLGIPVGSVTPVVMAGWAYVNVGTNTVAVGADLGTSATARVAATAAAASATSITALEANTAGIPSGDGTTNRLIRAWVRCM
jgi:hypothetical protein